jgi:hypothetical protein
MMQRRRWRRMMRASQRRMHLDGLDWHLRRRIALGHKSMFVARM